MDSRIHVGNIGQDFLGKRAVPIVDLQLALIAEPDPNREAHRMLSTEDVDPEGSGSRGTNSRIRSLVNLPPGSNDKRRSAGTHGDASGAGGGLLPI